MQNTTIVNNNGSSASMADDRPKLIGHVIFCEGSNATVLAENLPLAVLNTLGVSKFISLIKETRRIVALITSTELASHTLGEGGHNRVKIHVQMIGEVWQDPQTGNSRFDTGIREYPTVGIACSQISKHDLNTMFVSKKEVQTIKLGSLCLDANIASEVHLENLLSRHFAIVGSTGVGKSTATALILNKILDARASLRTVMFDPHNEYANAFGSRAEVFDIQHINIPFWLLNFEELCEVLFSGQKNIEFDIEFLRSAIPDAKSQFGSKGGIRRTVRSHEITVDTPLPYQFLDIIKYIDDAMGMLDNRSDIPDLRRLRGRLTTVLNDPRYSLFFNVSRVEDNILEILGDIFRLNDEQKPIAILQMAGAPQEVSNSLISVLGRLAFDICQVSDKESEILIVCEEAHRYVPALSKTGMNHTQRAISQIAKEGRKYGCYLCCITQRPSELNPTILSQCSTLFAMRLANEHDQDIIRSAISASSTAMVKLISALAQQEAIVFGEGVTFPMHFRFETLKKGHIPFSEANQHEDDNLALQKSAIEKAVDRLRNISNTQMQVNYSQPQETNKKVQGIEEWQRTFGPRSSGM